MSVIHEIGELSEEAGVAVAAIACYGFICTQLEQLDALEADMGERFVTDVIRAALERSKTDCEEKMVAAGVSVEMLTSS